jgi:putative membrane protein
MTGLVSFAPVVSAVVYALLGIVVFWLSFVILDWLTPGHLWKEVIEEQNTAVAIIFGAVALGICVIIAAAIHG